eukprot:TRINITY_DN247_c0_g1_i2.p1 TRINITY_DN247_c0_g1~~TRINITY_DN247_c0_g1_i2.p1  ORF type:complete len:358 (+),score=70.49 TRINITY_DN247_c0_g1_i2:169-1242(+)
MPLDLKRLIVMELDGLIMFTVVEDGVDHGAPIRATAEKLHEILTNPAALQAERLRARSVTHRIWGTGQQKLTGYGNSALADGLKIAKPAEEMQRMPMSWDVPQSDEYAWADGFQETGPFYQRVCSYSNDLWDRTDPTSHHVPKVGEDPVEYREKLSDLVASVLSEKPVAGRGSVPAAGRGDPKAEANNGKEEVCQSDADGKRNSSSTVAPSPDSVEKKGRKGPSKGTSLPLFKLPPPPPAATKLSPIAIPPPPQTKSTAAHVPSLPQIQVQFKLSARDVAAEMKKNAHAQLTANVPDFFAADFSSHCHISSSSSSSGNSSSGDEDSSQCSSGDCSPTATGSGTHSPGFQVPPPSVVV